MRPDIIERPGIYPIKKFQAIDSIMKISPQLLIWHTVITCDTSARPRTAIVLLKAVFCKNKARNHAVLVLSCRSTSRRQTLFDLFGHPHDGLHNVFFPLLAPTFGVDRRADLLPASHRGFSGINRDSFPSRPPPLHFTYPQTPSF